MGNIFSIQMSCDSLITRCWDCSFGQASYVCQLEDNFESLKTATQELRELREDVLRRVRVEELGQQLKRLEQVEGWLSRVEVAVMEVDEMIKNGPQEMEKLCLGGFFCSKNCKSSYLFGKKVAKRLQDVIDLKSKGDFKVVAEKLPNDPVVERPREPTVLGLETKLDEVWSCLMAEQVGIVGLYGMGGVGKTTLLTQINNKFLSTPNKFDVVIWVLVSKDMRLEKIQENIGKRIGFSDEKWKCKNIDDKAEDLMKVLSQKKFVLLLDDIWKRVDLVKIGVPIKVNASKLIFTTRLMEVCSHMKAQRIIKVEPLTWENAWNLFEENVGKETLSSHEEIPLLAKTVVEACDGLPLALITVARAMACKETPQEWHDAVEVLSKYPSSYKDDLIEYWVCEGFWDVEYDDGVGSHNKGYTIIGTLVRACLLEDEGIYVKLHDVIRDMALWIACEHEKCKETFLVQTGAQLIEAPEARKWKGVRRMSLIENSIQNLTEVPKCLDLLTLLLRDNPCLCMITDGFFQFMDALTVLDLSYSGISTLPLGISKLVSLQYLNLSNTYIQELPLELKMLLKLKYLNVENLDLIIMKSREVISFLSSIQVLRMFRCRYSYEEALIDSSTSSDSSMLVKELQCLKHLNVLSVALKCVSALQSFLGTDKLLSCTQSLSLESLEGSKSLNISPLTSMRQLGVLHLNCNNELEELQVDPIMQGEKIQELGSLQNSIFSRERCFTSLGEVKVGMCPNLQDLTWLILAPNLKVLGVSSCQGMKEIISGGKLGEVLQQGSKNLNAFAKLEVLDLVDLPQLRNIYWNVLPFPLLRKMKVRICPLLKKLPLDSSSAKRCKIVIDAEEDWWNDVQWEDDATKAAFLPYFTPVGLWF